MAFIQWNMHGLQANCTELRLFFYFSMTPKPSAYRKLLFHSNSVHVLSTLTHFANGPFSTHANIIWNCSQNI